MYLHPRAQVSFEQASCSTQLFTQGHKFRLSRQAAQLSFIVAVVVIVVVIAGFSVFFDYDYDNDMIHQSRFRMETTCFPRPRL
jgi:uncharacterized YccA/Bax inhibitor family protein